MQAKEFDEKFDQGSEDVIDDLDLSTARRVNEGKESIKDCPVERPKAERAGQRASE